MNLVKNRLQTNWKEIFAYCLLGSFLVLTLLILPDAIELAKMFMQFAVNTPDFTVGYLAWIIEGIILIFLFAGDGEQNEAKTR